MAFGQLEDKVAGLPDEVPTDLDAVKKRTGTEPDASHRLAGSGLWLLKLLLDP